MIEKKEQERRKKISNTSKKNKLSGGYRQGSGRGKSGWYKGYWCDSSWELAWVIYNLDHNIMFERNFNKFEYINDKNKKSFYIPDFKILDVYYEIKGYKTENVMLKIKSFPHKLIMVYEKDIKPYIEYCKKKYEVTSITSLYESGQSIEKNIKTTFSRLKVETVQEYIELRDKYTVKEISKIYKVRDVRLKTVNDYYNLSFKYKCKNYIKTKPEEKNGKFKKEEKNCIICKKQIGIRAIRCIKCDGIHRKQSGEGTVRKIKDRPTIESLIMDIKSYGYRGVAKKYNVSDTAVRKWIKQYGYDPNLIKKYIVSIDSKIILINDRSEKQNETTFRQRKVKDRPSLYKLLNEIKNLGYVQVGKKYGVSDNAVRKWVKKYGCDPKTFNKLNIAR